MITPAYLSLSLSASLPLFYPAFPCRHLVSISPPSPGHAPVHFRLFLWSSRFLQDEEEEGRRSQREGDSGVSRTRGPPACQLPVYLCLRLLTAVVLRACIFHLYLTGTYQPGDISLLSLLVPTPVSYQSLVLLERPQLYKGLPRTCHLPSGDWTASLGSRTEALGLFSG